MTPNELVRCGCAQVMEGRHCFGHLTVEENLLTGTYTRRERKSFREVKHCRRRKRWLA